MCMAMAVAEGRNRAYSFQIRRFIIANAIRASDSTAGKLQTAASGCWNDFSITMMPTGTAHHSSLVDHTSGSVEGKAAPLP